MAKKDITKQIMGLVIVSFRKECNGMSRYALAKQAGVDYAWLRRCELGTSGIRVETLLLLASGFGISSSIIIECMEKALADPNNWLLKNQNDLEEYMRSEKKRRVKEPLS